MSQGVMAFGPNLGLPEILVIAAVGLLLFGSRLPSVGRSLGRAIVQFKKGLRETKDEIEHAAEEDDEGETPKETTAKEAAPKKDKESPAG